MPTIEEVLQKETFKEIGIPVEKRVFYTLRKDPKHTELYQSKLLALLTAKLVEQELITEDELDELLLEVVS